MSNGADQLIELALRRERLVARAAAQRDALRREVVPLRRPLGWVDRAASAGRYLRSHPLLAGAAVAALIALRRRSVLSLAGRAFTAWRLWRSISALLAGRYS